MVDISSLAQCYLDALKIHTRKKVGVDPYQAALGPRIAPVCPQVQTGAFNAIFHQKKTGLLFSNLGGGQALVNRKDVLMPINKVSLKKWLLLKEQRRYSGCHHEHGKENNNEGYLKQIAFCGRP